MSAARDCLLCHGVARGFVFLSCLSSGVRCVVFPFTAELLLVWDLCSRAQPEFSMLSHG